MVITRETWTQARDAVCLGASLKDVADSYGINYGTLKDRARREAWPRPEKLPPPPPPLVPAPVVASRSLAQRGESHRALIADMVERALQQAAIAPPALESWSDIATAAKLGDKALGIDSPSSMISINFPASSSTEAPSYIDISTNSSPTTTMDPPPVGGTPLPLPEVPAP